MTEAQRALLDKVRRALEAAEANATRNDAETTISRAYYAAFYAALAALDAIGEHPKTHQGTQRRFHLHYVRTARVPREIGEIRSHALDFRQRADYDAFSVFEVQAAADLTADVRRFIETVEVLLRT